MAAVPGILLLAVAAVVLTLGAELFVENVAGAARRLGLTVLAVGVLLAGAEPEEALTGVLASAQGRPGLAAGDALGANITMLTAALGLAALARPLPVGRRVRQYAAGSALAGLAGLTVLADGLVTRREGALLVLAYATMVAAVWWREREPPAIGELAETGDEDDDPLGRTAQPATASGTRALLLALLGIATMTVGGALAVDGAARVVAAFGVGDEAVGLTALALATTAELFALVWAALRRDVLEVAVAGVVGSAAYNATVSLGLAALTHPLDLAGMRTALVLGAVAGAVLPLAVLLLARAGRLGRPAGAVLVLAYVGYLVAVLR